MGAFGDASQMSQINPLGLMARTPQEALLAQQVAAQNQMLAGQLPYTHQSPFGLASLKGEGQLVNYGIGTGYGAPTTRVFNAGLWR